MAVGLGGTGFEGQSLTLRAVSTEEGIIRAIRECDHLTELVFDRCTLTQQMLTAIAPQCKALRRFGMQTCVVPTDSHIAAFVKKCPALTQFSLVDCPLGTLLRVLPAHLTHLEAPFDTFPETELATFFTSHPQLTTLSVRMLTDGLLNILSASCKQLTSVQVQDFKKITTAGIQALMSNCSLTRLHTYQDGLSDEILQVIAQYGTALEELCLGYSPHISDTGLCPVVKKCPLKVLRLTSCKKITSLSLETLALFRKEMEQLTITFCREIDRLGILEVSEHCPKLQLLDIRDNPHFRVTPLFASRLAKNLTQLETLCISRLESQEALKALLPIGSQLRDLTITNAHYELTDDDLNHIAEHCTHLHTLFIGTCTAHCTTAGVRSFLQKLPLFKSFSFFETKYISYEELREEFPKVKIQL